MILFQMGGEFARSGKSNQIQISIVKGLRKKADVIPEVKGLVTYPLKLLLRDSQKAKEVSLKSQSIE
jgi:hypothetical protein